MAPFEDLNGRMCKTSVCWDDMDKRKLLGLKIVLITTDKVNVILEKIKIAQDWQRSYADNQRKDLPSCL